MGATQMSKGAVLNSWKEIASYMGRGVRTVQRYERDLGLPVRRPRGKSRSAVIAFSDEIDHWLHSAPKNENNGQGNGHPFDGDSPAVLHREIVVRAHETVWNSAELRLRCQQLRTEHESVLTSLMRSVESIANLFAKREQASLKTSVPGA